MFWESRQQRRWVAASSFTPHTIVRLVYYHITDHTITWNHPITTRSSSTMAAGGAVPGEKTGLRLSRLTLTN